MQTPKPVMLMILDGWGIAPPSAGNAVHLARTPHLDRLMADCPHSRLQTCGPAVGLPEGVMGNSEVGHLNLGAGRIVFQDLLRIDNAIADGRFFENPVLQKAMQRAAAGNGAVHLIGLLSDGGVHSQLTHLQALLEMGKRQGCDRLLVHAVLDGRDTAPDAGIDHVVQIRNYMQRIGTGAIATVCGRFYAMDRDTRWERTQRAYRMLTEGQGLAADDPAAAVREAYARGETDEFVAPVVLTGDDGGPRGLIRDGDAVIFFNFRADRARQLTRALTDPLFDAFPRTVRPKLADYVCMTLYDEAFDLPTAFAPEHLEQILGQVVSAQGLHQLRIAETEKYAHVTYFFNGGEEAPFDNEDRCLIPSPREVRTYDLKPEMSAAAVAEEVRARIDTDRYDLIVLNFANMDMVGHTGSIEAAVRACETVDRCVGAVVAAVRAKGGALLITADHGNAETMRSTTGKPHTAHTTNPVPLILVDDRQPKARLRQGILADVAPTLLALMGVDPPAAMTGRCLIADDNAKDGT
ncbi:2,3-bisphosphoglycerate-independent phosphoglycerate mutase [Desulfatitalea alkaliphila]|uniref:2,3-bisphosphoglycerate-independent phosphoglycerate mutase n=1 Tax=Desulfatitalea alkaliphila TaxID=2929485 RepID=A0AA41R527_9BACT|nr:2,3-bisphosphoglycerate-independent phosphoglycerate mutase [Desulfatitalea alkaliphila]MCJ8500936.1 2,3-bisphosphoglycerate-independent phosphoglycerate mutase [Desulfatitalea alkaliphila]